MLVFERNDLLRPTTLRMTHNEAKRPNIARNMQTNQCCGKDVNSTYKLIYIYHFGTLFEYRVQIQVHSQYDKLANEKKEKKKPGRQ